MTYAQQINYFCNYSKQILCHKDEVGRCCGKLDQSYVARTRGYSVMQLNVTCNQIFLIR
jgi:hypothetical protein